MMTYESHEYLNLPGNIVKSTKKYLRRVCNIILYALTHNIHNNFMCRFSYCLYFLMRKQSHRELDYLGVCRATESRRAFLNPDYWSPKSVLWISRLNCPINIFIHSLTIFPQLQRGAFKNPPLKTLRMIPHNMSHVDQSDLQINRATISM